MKDGAMLPYRAKLFVPGGSITIAVLSSTPLRPGSQHQVFCPQGEYYPTGQQTGLGGEKLPVLAPAQSERGQNIITVDQQGRTTTDLYDLLTSSTH